MGGSLNSGPFLGPFMRVLYYFGDLKKGPDDRELPIREDMV